MTPNSKSRAAVDGARITAADLITPWPRADRLDRAIQEIAKRWLTRSLLVTMAGCSAAHEHAADMRPRATLVAPVPTGDRPGTTPPADFALLASDAGPDTNAPDANAPDANAPDANAPDANAPDANVATDPLAPFAPDLLAADSDFDPIDCNAAGAWDPMPHVKPSQAFDYAALRVFSYDHPDMVATTSEVGTACLNASDTAACHAVLDMKPATAEQNHCGQAGCNLFFVATTLDGTPKQWSTRDELLAFLGPIDSPEDALLLVFYDGYALGHAEQSGCETAAVRKVDDGYEIYATELTDWCAPIRITRYLLKVSTSGEVTQLRSATASEEQSCIGRRPEGLVADDVSADSALGAFFARHAQLEAASVHAFEHMIAELIAHAAPSELIAEARAAREDEVRHARLVGELACKYGAVVPALHVAAPAARPLLSMAIENAVEGCVRETWGALIGTYQAQRTRDPEIAAVLIEIAGDERRHATLSWRVAAWLDMHLTAAERAQVAGAYRTAIAQLREAEAWPKSVAVSRAVGLPDPATALALLDELDAEFWAAA